MSTFNESEIFNTAIEEYKKQNYTTSKKCFKKLIIESPREMYKYDLSICYYHLKKFEKSLIYLGQVIDVSLQSNDPPDKLANFYFQELKIKEIIDNEPKPLIKEYESKILDKSVVSKYFQKFGELYEDLAQRTEQGTKKKRLETLKYKFTNSLPNLGFKLSVLMDKRDRYFIRSIVYCNKAKELEHQNSMKNRTGSVNKELVSESNYCIGRCHFGLSNFALSRKYFEKCIKDSPRNTTAISDLGTAYSNDNKWRKSISCYQCASYLNPDNFSVYNKKGMSLLELNNTRTNKKATKAFLHSINLIKKEISSHEISQSQSQQRQQQQQQPTNNQISDPSYKLGIATYSYKGLIKALNRLKKYKEITFYLKEYYQFCVNVKLVNFDDPENHIVIWIKRKLARSYQKTNNVSKATMILNSIKKSKHAPKWKVSKRLSICYKNRICLDSEIKRRNIEKGKKIIKKTRKKYIKKKNNMENRKYSHKDFTLKIKEHEMIIRSLNYELAKIYQLKGKFYKACMQYNASKNEKNMVKIYYKMMLMEYYQNEYKKSIKLNQELNKKEIQKRYQNRKFEKQILLLMDLVKKNSKYQQYFKVDGSRHSKSPQKISFKGFEFRKLMQKKKYGSKNFELPVGILIKSYFEDGGKFYCLQYLGAVKLLEFTIKKGSYIKRNTYETSCVPKELINSLHLIIKCIVFEKELYVFTRNHQFQIMIYKLKLARIKIKGKVTFKWSKWEFKTSLNRFLNKQTINEIIVNKENHCFVLLSASGDIFLFYIRKNYLQKINLEKNYSSNSDQTFQNKNYIYWINKKKQICLYKHNFIKDKINAKRKKKTKKREKSKKKKKSKINPKKNKRHLNHVALMWLGPITTYFDPRLLLGRR
ncbi:cellulose synthase operon protein c [Anaeramoeba flamelloides]|uniref:Cellulose synthase operon protein c n=1 Tax=Anaeramoeba flamelloides TaxID=1746091 RepID=A0ABQ8XFH0_9EUKA|nr:cellulose synthase operon protein c [Anaeramoeba flamelloides]